MAFLRAQTLIWTQMVLLYHLCLGAQQGAL